jgi:phenylpyruvate tautomerase PptA (4-oxalocrotonate tautomerase family)
MPIPDIEITLRPGEDLSPGLAAEIADRCGEVFGSLPGSTWVKLHPLPHEHYAENGGDPHAGVNPVFVSAMKARLPAPDALRVEVARLGAAIAEASGRPVENVQVAYLPAGAGRVAFGGELVSAE